MNGPSLSAVLEGTGLGVEVGVEVGVGVGVGLGAPSLRDCSFIACSAGSVAVAKASSQLVALV